MSTQATENEVLAELQRELQRAQAEKNERSAEFLEASDQAQILRVREKTTSDHQALLLRDVAITSIPYLCNGRGKKPDPTKLIELERELALIRAARAWLDSRLPRLRVTALRSEGYTLVREADLEEFVARLEQRASAVELAKLQEVLGPRASLIINGASFQERARRASELVERGSRLLREAAELERTLQAA